MTKNVIGRNRGTTMKRTCLNLLAPSISEASKTALGRDCKAVRYKTILKPRFFHTVSKVKATNANHLFCSQSGPEMPILPNQVLIKPE